ncbi:MAG: type II secretion system F family protein [archaeon]
MGKIRRVKAGKKSKMTNKVGDVGGESSAKKEASRKKVSKIFGVLFALVVGVLVIIIKRNAVASVVCFFVALVLFFVFVFVKNFLDKSTRVREMEDVFPDFLQLVAGNLRAGITIDKSILISARKEFGLLDKEIMRVGKDIATGRSTEIALCDMAKRIGSEKIEKTIMLINSGLRSGGNLAILLERTASNMRERGFVEKRAASNVLMYEIFIFVAVAIGAPALFALSTILVQTMGGMMSSAPELEATIANLNVPISFSKISISLNFIVYYSIAFIIVIGVLSSLVIGLVSKGNERDGLKYLIPILLIGLSIFLLIRYFLSGFVSGLF